MNDHSARILIVDDQETLATSLKVSLEREFKDDASPPEVEICTSFDEAEKRLQKEPFDLAVLDVRLDATDSDVEDLDRGRKLYDRVCAVQWLPVVFFTAASAQMQDLSAPPLVTVVNKRHTKKASVAVRDGLDSGLPQFTRRVGDEMDTMLRAFLRDEVRPYWDKLSEDDKKDIVPVLANRLSAFIRQKYLDETHAERFGHASAARFYLYPPVNPTLVTGDVVQAEDNWLVVLTPQCDLVEAPTRPRKAEFLRVAPAVPVAATSPAKVGNANKLRSALTNNERYFLLPAFRSVPDLLVDFEQVTAIGFDDDRVAPDKRVATIDSPFCEAMLSRLGRYVSRLGFEDLPVDHLVNRAVDASTR